MAQTTTGFDPLGRARQHAIRSLLCNNTPCVDVYLELRKERQTVQDLEHELDQLEANQNRENTEADALRKVLDQAKVEIHGLKSNQGRQIQRIKRLELDLKSAKQALDDTNAERNSLVEECKQLGGRYNSVTKQAHEYHALMEYINWEMSQNRRAEMMSQLDTDSLRPLDCYKYIESQLDDVIDGQEDEQELRSQIDQLSSENALLTERLSREIEEKYETMIELYRSRAQLKSMKGSISEKKPEHKPPHQECNDVIQSEEDAQTPDESQKPATDRLGIDEVTKWPIMKIFNCIKMQVEQLIKGIRGLKEDTGETSCWSLSASAADIMDTVYDMTEEDIQAALENNTKPGSAVLTQLLHRHAVLLMIAPSVRILGTDQVSDLELVAYIERVCDEIRRTTVEDINYFGSTGMVRKMVDDATDLGYYNEELADSAPPKNIIRNGE